MIIIIVIFLLLLIQLNTLFTGDFKNIVKNKKNICNITIFVIYLHSQFANKLNANIKPIFQKCKKI